MLKVKFSGEKGLTLVEIIVAIAILAIIITMFSGAFTNGFSSIINGGNKTRAAETAQSIVDRIYKAGSIDDGIIAGIEPGMTKKNSYNELISAYTAGETSRYFAANVTISGVTLKKIIVLVFYSNGSNYSMVTTYIP